MPTAHLAIETASAHSSLTLGLADEILGTVKLPQPRRHHLELMPALANLCEQHGLAPADLSEVYVSLGPGSFTGLRMGLTTAKMLALTLGVGLVGVPTLDVLAHNAPDHVQRVAVCLNLKRETVYCALYDAKRQQIAEPALRSASQLLDLNPDAILGDPLPPLPEDAPVLPAELAIPRSEHVYRLGRSLASQNIHADPDTMAPLYIREPEAVTLWNQRYSPE